MARWHKLSSVAKTSIVVAGVVGLLGLSVIGIFGLKMVFGGPAELSDAKYAKEFCDAVEDHAKDSQRTFEKMVSNRDLSDPDSVGSEREAKRIKDLAIEGVDQLRLVVEDVRSFNDSHILRGREGEEFRQDLSEALDDLSESLDEMKVDFDELDPADEGGMVEDLASVLSDYDNSDLTVEDGDPGWDMAVKLSDEEYCNLFNVYLPSE